MIIINALWVVLVSIGVCGLASMLFGLLGIIMAFLQPLPNNSDRKTERKVKRSAIAKEKN